MMRMSTKGHHATRVMIFLAGSPARPMSKVEIGDAEAIPTGYLQQIMVRLTDAGLVRSFRGKAGGFTLARPAEEITIQEVLQATEGPFEFAPCVDCRQECPRSEVCPAHALWQDATTIVNDLFERTTDADLVQTGRLLEEKHAR
jgi:Rrf2 family protein